MLVTLSRRILGLIACGLALLEFAPGHVLAKPKSPAAVDVLGVATQVGREHDGWKYGSDARKDEINCVQFILLVVLKLEPNLPDAARQRILISDLSAAQCEADADGIVSK